jgi:integrase
MSLVGRNVAALIEPPHQSPSKARALTSDEAASVLALAEEPRDQAYFLLALTTGCRRGELAALQWDAVDLDGGVVIVRQAFGEDRRGKCFLKVTKSERQRIIPMARAAIDALKATRARQAAEELAAKPGTYENRGFVFADKHGRPPDLNRLSKTFAKLARLAGISGATLHSCRHFTATLAISEGSDVRSVAAIMGHAQPSTTLNVYGHVVPGAKNATVQRVGDALAQAQARLASGENRSGTGGGGPGPLGTARCNQTATNDGTHRDPESDSVSEAAIK